MDGIPESVAIGISLIGGGAVSWVFVVAVFLSNAPEGLSAAAGMKKAGRSTAYILGLWGAVVVASAASGALCSGISSWPERREMRSPRSRRSPPEPS